MDKDLLLDTIKFPLKYDGISYIWDATSDMVAQKIDESDLDYNHLTKALNSYKEAGFPEVQNTGYRFIPEYDIIQKGAEELYFDIRGWGRIQYLDRPEERMQAVGDFF